MNKRYKIVKKNQARTVFEAQNERTMEPGITAVVLPNNHNPIVIEFFDEKFKEQQIGLTLRGASAWRDLLIQSLEYLQNETNHEEEDDE